MKRIKFELFQDVTAEATTNPLTTRLKGSAASIAKIIKKLTVRNKGIKFQIEYAQKAVLKLNGLISSASDPTEKARLVEELAGKFSEITELQSNEILHLYTKEGDGSLEVPAGFWWFAGSTDGSNINKTLKECYLPGLRPYQIEALRELFKYNRAGICLATGLGKSKIIASLCKAAEESSLRACIVVPTDYLVGQMVETIKEHQKSVCGVGGGRKFKLGSIICVTTAQSAMKVIDNFDVIIIDEAHHAPASTWLDILSNSRATHVYCLTATPFRSDGLDMAIHSFTGPIVYERDARWGIANGWLKPCKVYLKIIERDRPLTSKMNSQLAYKILSSSSNVLHEIKEHLLKATKSGRKCIVLFKTVKACQALKKYCGTDLDFAVASSKYKKPIDDFRDGLCNILVSNDRLISEGLDIPDADFLIMATQNSSAVITSQAVGRVLRKPKDDEGFAIVIDITFGGYQKFERCRPARENVYELITDDVFDIGVK